MSKTVDQKVVEMQFDNKNFEKNVSKSMSTLDKLKKALKFDGASKGLEDVQRKADSLRFHGLANTVDQLADKFSGLQMVGTMAMMRIAQSAADAGIRMVKSMSLDNITAGFNKLSQKTTSVATLVSQGYSLDVVEEQLAKLNWFSDETSYNFTDMIDNISKFTATGKGLEDSTTAMQGIAIWAASAGQNAQKATSAMYQLSQALSAGYMRKEDWKSIQNVNMDTAEFRQQALDAGVALKKLKKNADGTYTSLVKDAGKFTREQFAEHLTEDAWFTSEVMMMTYQNYAKASDQIYDVVNKMKDEFDTELLAAQVISAAKAAKEGDEAFEKYAKSIGLSTKESAKLKELTKTIDDFGLKNFALAQEYKTFQDVLDATSDAVSTKWMGVFEKIFGNYEEQKELWGTIGESFYDFFAAPVANLESLLGDWKDLGGRDDLLEGLGNVANSIGAIVKPIKEAFREIFPPMTAERLAEFTKKFKEFTSHLTIGEKTSNAIRNTFKGLFSVIKTGINIVTIFAKAIWSVVSVFAPLGKGIVYVTGAIGKWVDKTSESIRTSDKLSKVVNTATNAIKNFASRVGTFLKETLKFDRILNFFKSLFGLVSKAALAIGKFIGTLIRNGDLKNIADLFNAGLLGGLIATVTKFFKGLGKAAENLEGFTKNLKGMLGDVRDVLKSYQKEIQAKTLMTIAKAVGILAVSLLVLSLINPEKLGSALTAMAGSMVGLMLMFKAFSKMGENKIYARTSLGLVAMSAAVLILATAIKKLSGLSLGQVATSLVALGVGLGIMVYALQKMPDAKKVTKKTSSLIAMSISLLIMAKAMQQMAKMSFVDIGKVTLAMVSSLTIMVTALNKMNPDKAITKTMSLFIAATAMIVLGGALKLLATMSWSEIGRALTAMAGALGIMVVAMNLLGSGNKIAKKNGFSGMGVTKFSSSTAKSGGAIGKSIALIGAASAMIILGGALKILATMSWDSIARSLTAMGGALAILVVAMKIMGSSFKSAATGAGALIVAANALVILGLGLKLLGSMKLESIGKALLSLAGTFIIIGVAGAVLSKVAMPLLAVAGAMALFGVACVAFGIGLNLISAGILALGAALAGGATAIVAGLGAILLGVLGLVPEIIKICGEVLIGLCNLLIDLAPVLGKAIMMILYETLKSLADYTPLIVTEVMNLLINVLRAVADRAPELIVAVVEVLNAIFKGFVQALQILDPKTFVVGIACVGMLAGIMYLMAGLASIAPMALIGVAAFGVLALELAGVVAILGKLLGKDSTLENIAKGGNVLEGIGTAIGKFVGGLIGGFMSGASKGLPDLAKNLSEFMTNLQPFLSGIKNIDLLALPKLLGLSAGILILTATDFVVGIANIIGLGNSFGKLGTNLSEFMTNAQGFLNGVKNVDESTVLACGALSACILALTASNMINNLSNLVAFFTGGNSLSEFGEEFEGLGTNMRNFVNNLGTFGDSEIKTIECACNALVSLSNAAKKIPNSGGVAGFFAGENDIDVWGNKLPALAKGLNSFVKELDGFTEAQITVAECAAKCIVVMSEAASQIPNSGGMAALFAGDNDISEFGDKLPNVASKLSEFVKNLGEFGEDKIAIAECAAKVIVAMANAASQIPNSGGMVTLFTGDNDISEFGDKLPGVATNLSEFIGNLDDFGENQIKTAECAAKVIVAMAEAASKIPKSGGGIRKLFTGDNDISEFADKLPGVATQLSKFIKNVGEFGPDAVNTANCAANVIATMAKAAATVPGEGGLKSLFTGDNDITEFGEKLPGMATNLSLFISNLGEFGEDKIATADCAARVIATMAETASKIPASGGLKQAFTGDNDISEFGDKLPGVATNLNEFLTNLGEFGEGKIATADCAAKAIVAMAEAATKIPKSGGIAQLFSGDNDISKFAGKLPTVGTSLKGYIQNIGTFGDKQVNTVNASTSALQALAKVSGIDISNLVEKLKNLPGIGTTIKTFVSNISGLDSDLVEKAKTNMTGFVELANDFTTINADNITKLGNGLKTVAETGLDGFVNAFQGDEPKTKVTQAIRDLIDKMITSAELKRGDLTSKFTSIAQSVVDSINSSSMLSKMYNVGKYFAEGFANGINDNKYLATNAGTSLGNAAYNAAKKAIDAHSPSKKSYKLGGFFGQGFINGIKEYTDSAYSESYSMAEEANKGLTKAISTIDDILSGTMDGQPTIRPVLDLTDVESGASAISSMFNNMNVGANLNAISSGMKNKPQNGNSEVVSAIDKLGKNLETTGGNTYNLGDISYSDDTAIGRAVQELVRAVEVERRV